MVVRCGFDQHTHLDFPGPTELGMQRIVDVWGPAGGWMFHTLLCQILSKHLFTIYVWGCYTVVVNGPLQQESAGHHAGQRPACPNGGTKDPLLGQRQLGAHQAAQAAELAERR